MNIEIEKKRPYGPLLVVGCIGLGSLALLTFVVVVAVASWKLIAMPALDPQQVGVAHNGPGAPGGLNPKPRPKWDDVKPDWQELDLAGRGPSDVKGRIQDMGEFLRFDPESGVSTKESFTGPIEIATVARTTKHNIRFSAFHGASLIFNWEVQPSELRLCRPDGIDQPETGSVATARYNPLVPGRWYLLRWLLTEKQIDVYIDDDRVFSEIGNYNVTPNHQVRIYSKADVIEVKTFNVYRLDKLGNRLP